MATPLTSANSIIYGQCTCRPNLSINLHDMSEVLPYRTFYISFHVVKIPCSSMENLGQEIEHLFYTATQN